MISLTREEADELYDILVQECKAPDDPKGWERTSFVIYMTDDTRSKEFRFQGALGFGGKCRLNSNHEIPYVDYYREDHTPERDAMVMQANRRIGEMFGEMNDEPMNAPEQLAEKVTRW